MILSKQMCHDRIGQRKQISMTFITLTFTFIRHYDILTRIFINLYKKSYRQMN